MEGILFLALVVLIIFVMDNRSKIKHLQAVVDRLRSSENATPTFHHEVENTRSESDNFAEEGSAPVEPVRYAARKEEVPTETLQETAADEHAEEQPELVTEGDTSTIEAETFVENFDESEETLAAIMQSEPSEPVPTFAERFEKIVGERLPIWIGGIAFIFAAFFLVRYSIEAGLVGPRVRSITAALFGTLLLGLSEFGGRIPKIGPAIAADKRIGQSLAGAAIAIFYGTLYMASELYGLIGPITAFILVVAVTALALFLSLKKGPPTAIMGLLGGFAAPYVAGLGPESMGPLLIYLGVFTIGLFALAIHRGWIWLALLATGGSVLWSSILMLWDTNSDTQFVGLFVIFLAIAGVLTLRKISNSGSAFSESEMGQRMLNSTPLAIGLLQLAFLAPVIEFSTFGWLMYGALSLFAIILSWRDSSMTIGVAGALALFSAMLIGAFFSEPVPNGLMWVALAMALLFGISGHLFAFRKDDGWMWALIGLAGPTAAYAIPLITDTHPIADHLWAWLALSVAASAAFIAWRAQVRINPETAISEQVDLGIILPLASAISAALLILPAVDWPSELFIPSAVLLVALGLAAWARYTDNKAIRLMVFAPIMLSGIAALFTTFQYGDFAEAIGDDRIPPMIETFALELLPAALFAGIAWLLKGSRTGNAIHWLAYLGATATLMALLPLQWTAALFAALTLLVGHIKVKRLAPPLASEISAFASILAVCMSSVSFLAILAMSITGETLHYETLITLKNALIEIAIPALILLTGLVVNGGQLTAVPKQIVSGAIAIMFGALLYLLLKQPFAIATYEQFTDVGFLERAIITQLLLLAGFVAMTVKLADRFAQQLRPIGFAIFMLGLARFIGFDLLLLNPVLEQQKLGTLPILNLGTIHFAILAFWLWFISKNIMFKGRQRTPQIASLLVMIATVLITVKQAIHGTIIAGSDITTAENYLYSVGLLALALGWLWFGLRGGIALLRLAGLLLLTLVTFKVFLIDASALDGLLRVISFLGLGIALMVIGWSYRKIMGTDTPPVVDSPAEEHSA